MVGPLPAGRKWTNEDEKQLLELLTAGVKAPAIARQLKRSTGAVYARISALKKMVRGSLPSEHRLAGHVLESNDTSK